MPLAILLISEYLRLLKDIPLNPLCFAVTKLEKKNGERKRNIYRTYKA
jgi:hypothetical protein